MADKQINSTLNITSLLGTDILYVARLSTNQDCYITATALIASLASRPVTHATCQYNQSTNILLASAAMVSAGTIKSVTLQCYFERNLKSRSEIVTVSYTDGQSSILSQGYSTIPETETDLGITLTSDNSSGLNLVVTVDSEAYNVDLYYNILSIISI